MGQLTGNGKEGTVDRRGFLKGSALMAAAVAGVTLVAPALARAQEPGKPEGKTDGKKPDEKDEKEKADQEKGEAKKPGDAAGDQARKDAPAKTGEQAKNDPNKLFDKDGREYRVCDRCGGNMYKEGSTWTCEQCGFSYVE
jgi:hypothetical protein